MHVWAPLAGMGYSMVPCRSLTHSILRLWELISLKQPAATAQILRYFPVIYTWNEDEADKDSKI